jgi:hypothetical protein
MNMKMRIALAALLGGLTLFAWGAVSHMVLMLGDAGLKVLPAQPADQALLDAMKATLPEEGMYMFPGMDETKKSDEAEMARWTERTKTEPHGVIVYNTNPYAGMGGPLAKELVTDVAVAGLAALLLSWALGCCARYVGRVAFVTTLGLLVAYRPIQQWNWYEFPGTYSHAQVLDGVLGFLAMGLVIAAIVKPAKPA